MRGERPTHICTQDERIRILSSRMDKVETKVENIELTLSKLLWAIFGTLGTSVITLIVLLFQQIGGK